MERKAWLQEIRRKTEGLYDDLAPQYWVTFGFYENETHLACLRKFLERVAPGGGVLSAGCGAGRYDGLLLEAGHPVVGVDQSAGMLKMAQERYPEAQYEKVGLQELDFHEAFDGVICIDAMEHVCPEDYPEVLRKFQEATKPGGWLYITVERSEPGELEEAFNQARAKGLPMVWREMLSEVNITGALAERRDQAVELTYHFYPTVEQVRRWMEEAGWVIESEDVGSGYRHFLGKKAFQAGDEVRGLGLDSKTQPK